MDEVGGEMVRAMRAPREPTDKEIEEHMATHGNYRGWCPHCVAGKGKALAHAELNAETQHTVPTISMDYCFMGSSQGSQEVDEISKHCLPILVVRDHRCRWVDSKVVPKKGASHPFVPKSLAKDLKASGYGKFSFKTDQEPAIIQLKHAAVAELRKEMPEVTVLFEESARYASASNSTVERCHWEVESMTRTLRHHAEAIHNIQLATDHPLLVWAVRYSGQLISRCQRSSLDGRTTLVR